MSVVALGLIFLTLPLLPVVAATTCDDSPDFAEFAEWSKDMRSAASSALPTASCSGKKVLLIGIDGLRADAAAMLPLPNFHRLSTLGTSTFWAKVQASDVAVSGPGWASLLTGHETTDHLVNSNGEADMKEIAHPTVLKTAKDAFPELKIAATVTWHPLINNFIDHQDANTLDARHFADSDEEATQRAEEWIESGEFDFIFVDLDECDGAGHSYGFDGYADQYSEAVFEMDKRVGRLLDAVLDDSQGMEYLIVLTTDHGGQGTSHGASNSYNRRIPFFVASNSNRVSIGTMPREDTGSHMDVLPTIMHFLGGPIASDLEGQVFGFNDYTRAPPPTPAPCAADPSTCSCERSQSDYRGTVSKTVSGIECMKWTSQFHSHGITNEEYPNSGIGDHNYCRNPDGEPAAWCYTTDPDVRWELCEVPRCSDLPSGSKAPTPASTPSPTQAPSDCACAGDQSDYRGTKAATANGRTCMRWDSQDPHSHSRTASNYPTSGLDENYCRNPDGEAGAWCYTTDPGVRWELCDVPQCSSCERRGRLLRGPELTM